MKLFGDFHMGLRESLENQIYSIFKFIVFSSLNTVKIRNLFFFNIFFLINYLDL